MYVLYCSVYSELDLTTIIILTEVDTLFKGHFDISRPFNQIFRNNGYLKH